MLARDAERGGEGRRGGRYGVKFLRNEGRMKCESGANVGICQFFLNRCDIKADRL